MQPIAASTLNLTTNNYEPKIKDSLFEIKELKEFEIDQIQDVIEKSAYLMKEYSCNENTLRVIEKLPIELRKKLKVIIETHENNGVISYFGKSFSHHVFLISKTENSMIIFDPEVNSGKMLSAQWIKSAFNKDNIDYALTNSYTMKYLPQFRIVEADSYIDNYDDSLDFSTLSPEFRSPESKSGMSNSRLWQNSIRINLYDAVKLFSNEIPYKEIVKNHDGYKSPLGKINAREIELLHEFYAST